MTILLVIFLILIIYYFVKSSRDISIYIKRILKLKELGKNAGQPEDINDKKPKNKIKNRKSQYFNHINLNNLNNPSNGLINNKKSNNIERQKFKKEKGKKKNQSNDNNCIINTGTIKAPPKRKVNKKIVDNFLDSDNKSIINKKNVNKSNILLPNIQASLDCNENEIKRKNSENQIYKNKVENNKKQGKNIINVNNNINISVQYDSNIFIKSSNKNINKLKKEKPKKYKKRKSVIAKPNKNIKKETDKNNDNNSKRKRSNSVKIDVDIIKKLELMSLNDQEMNTLEYEKAIEFDKRSYFQYYFSLLKKKQLILFTFLPANDYNVMSLKISLFIVSFSLYLTINAFFFNDEAMHKIYKDNGVFDILYQIPQILYSSIIPTIINILLKTLSLTEKDLLKIKQETDYNNMIEQSKKIERCIIIKFIIFFIISLLLMLFFWYFISCFCAVYNNTQIILFKDTLISFGISMMYPFGINLIPGIFRIPALRAQKKDKECLYKISTYIALI